MITDERMKELIENAKRAAIVSWGGGSGAYRESFSVEVYATTLTALIKNESNKDLAVEAFAER
jgi:hypothetical protein